MAIRTKTALESQVSTLLADNTTGLISEADVRSVFTDVIDTLFDLTAGGSGQTGDHSRYVGWSADRIIATADFAGAETAESNDLTLPATSVNGYIWFAVPEAVGYPTMLHIAGGSRNALNAYEQLTGTVDDDNGDPHIIGVSYQVQISALAGQAFVLGY